MSSIDTYTGAERRVHTRYFDKLHVRIDRMDNFTLNFSEGGISIVADTVLDKNDTINMKLVLPRRADPIHKNLIYIDNQEPGLVIQAEAKVVWNKTEFEKMTVNGLEFQGLPENHQKALTEFIQHYQQQVKTEPQ